MAVGKEIRTKIKSVKNTQKITRAMEMVAASKMRRAQEKMQATRPYSNKMRNVISHLAHAHPEYQHPYMQRRDVTRVGVIVVSSDRGLCGGLNSNLLRATVIDMKQWKDENIKIDLCTVGKKAGSFFSRFGGNVVAEISGLGDRPQVSDIIGAVKVMLDAFDKGEIDALHLVYNEFVNTMTQKPTNLQLLPIQAEPEEELKHHWDYMYEPEAKEVLDALLMRYIESLVYQGVVENLACEQAARMVAMKSASDNAGDIITDLQRVYNKARQAAITQEISEIVGGAAAIQ
ncbi:ATP synthase gamma chain [hydrothermal vent metagenome]|uniref:ATP synthase gamma chain n=1 Tax=hydrothermal vent metagenome TaxID=652676 RepID=A0A3B1A0S8_9ZZZZ